MKVPALCLFSFLVLLPATSFASRLTGRISFSDPRDCTVGGTANAGVPWSGCHAFKRHFNPSTGAKITTNAYVANAVRPLTATIFFVFTVSGQGSPCATALVQTDREGRYSLTVPSCVIGRDTFVNPTVMLYYTMADSAGNALGTVRSLWAREDVVPLYGSSNASVNTLVDTVFSEPDVSGRVVNYIVPTVTADRVFLNRTQTRAQTIALGNHIVFNAAGATDYTRGALASWQNSSELHYRMRDRLGSRSDLYRTMFVTDSATACAGCFTVYFNLPGSGGLGGAGAFVTDGPRANMTSEQIGAMSAAGLMAHELGHSLHAGAAPAGFRVDYTFADSRTNPNGITYSKGGHSPHATGVIPQQQHMGVAFVEGFADMAMRLFAYDGCNGPDPFSPFEGDLDMRSNMWNPDAYAWCDSLIDSGCPFHNFRFHMSARGIGDNTPTWSKRLSALRELANKAQSIGMKRVLTNNEERFEQFFCILLADQPDYTSAAGKLQGQRYIRDFPYVVSEILDGRSPKVTNAAYASDVTSDRGRVTLALLLESMNNLCPGCDVIPSPLAPALWTQLPLVDGAQGVYNWQHISIDGLFSAQAVGIDLMNRGWLTKAQLNNALRASFMEEVP